MNAVSGSRADETPRIGTFIAVPDIVLAEAIAGFFDPLVVDVEHGAIDVAEAQRLMIAIQGRGAQALVRVPSASYERLPALLDAGADGVVAPMMESAEEASEFVARLRYPPTGRRGYGPRRAAARSPRGDQFSSSVACAVQIESIAGVDASAQIASVDGVDLVVVGCADLALDLGTPGRFDTPELRAAISQVAAGANEAGAGFGLAGGATPSDLARLTTGTVDLVLYGLDLRMYVAAAEAVAVDIRRELRAKRLSAGSSTTDGGEAERGAVTSDA